MAYGWFDNGCHHAHVGLFAVGNQFVAGTEVRELAVVRSGGSRGCHHAVEVLANPTLCCSRVEITRYDYSHALRDIVLPVILAERFVGGVANDVFLADGHELCHACAFGHLTNHAEHGAVAFRIAALELADDDAALVVNGLVLQRGSVCKISHDGEGKIHRLILQVGQIEHVNRALQGGVGVGIAAKAEPQLLHGGDELAALEVAAAVEDHVLQEVGDTTGFRLLIQRTCCNIQAHTGATRWLFGGAYDVAEAVLQLAANQLRVLNKLQFICCRGL